MESTEKCEAIIQHFNGKYIKTPHGVPGEFRFCYLLCLFLFLNPMLIRSKNQYSPMRIMLVMVTTSWHDDLLLTPDLVPTEPLLCKFADGGQKKRQSQGKYLQNGRSWTRDSESVSLFITFSKNDFDNNPPCG